MFEFIKTMFGPGVNYKSLVEDEGAVVLDVRTPSEYKTGHIKGSRNAPLNSLTRSSKLPKSMTTPVITCCASGRRSGIAKSHLQAMGYEKVYNGGGWRGLKGKL